MLNFITANIPTILVGAVVLAVVSAVFIKLIRDKRHHKSSCSGCSGCSCADKCSHHG